MPKHVTSGADTIPEIRNQSGTVDDTLRAIRADEAEECARIAEEVSYTITQGDGEVWIARKLADSIRKRRIKNVQVS